MHQAAKADAYRAINDHARWVIERYEALNDGIMTRAGTLAGFGGVELGLISQVVIQALTSTASKTVSHSFKIHLFVIFGISVVSILFSIFAFLKSLSVSSNYHYPDMTSLRLYANYLDTSSEEELVEIEQKESWIFDHLQNRDQPIKSIGESSLTENADRGKWFKKGVIGLVVTQAVIAILMFFLFWGLKWAITILTNRLQENHLKCHSQNRFQLWRDLLLEVAKKAVNRMTVRKSSSKKKAAPKKARKAAPPPKATQVKVRRVKGASSKHAK